ncbi:PLC-like phosphodiesterase [Flagelloscypha sp. PMI_526]|nr:PLC-like phosphodiesterase [Flagelloscypha sp. PMI_526]
MTIDRKLPQCWGHRGASARFPENTLASFEAAIRDGADGIESDVHVSKDNVVIMFHDPTLQRTTDHKGAIKELNWEGPDGMKNARTLKEPKQPIPTFVETVELLMKPENHHVQFNIDVKASNSPTRVFTLIHQTISKYPNWETVLAPRLLLGLWHPKFLEPAKELLPYCKRSSISFSMEFTRWMLWDDVDCVSIWFRALGTWRGQRFLKQAKKAGKTILVFTVNEPEHLLQCTRWGVDVIITDTTNRWLDLRKLLQDDYDRTMTLHSNWFLWTQMASWSPLIIFVEFLTVFFLRSWGGPFVRKALDAPVPGKVQLEVAAAADAVVREVES